MEIKLKLEELTHDVIARLHYHQQKAKTVSVIIKDTNFQQYSRSITFNKYVDDYDQIIVALIKLFESNFLQVVIRLVGVSLSNLIENKFLNITSELFDDFQKNDFKVEKTLQEKIAEQINEKFSKDIIGIAKNKLTSN
jgi:DNA polymerase-4